MTVDERQTKRAKKAMIMEDFVADMIVCCDMEGEYEGVGGV